MLARLAVRSGRSRDAEILALRHQVHVLQRQIDRPRFTPTDRTILAVLSRAFDRPRLGRVMFIANPATVIGWHRRLVALHWTQPPMARTGRPFTPAGLRRLTLRVDTDDPNRGHWRIHGEIRRLRHRIAASTVWRTLRGAGRTVRHVLLDRTLIWNQRQLQRLLDDFVEHHNEHRPHRSLGQRAPASNADASVIDLDEPIQRTTTCAGLINEYRPAA